MLFPVSSQQPQNSTILFFNTFQSQDSAPQQHIHSLYHTSSTISVSHMNLLSKLSTTNRFVLILQISLILLSPSFKTMAFHTKTYASSLKKHLHSFHHNPTICYCQSFNFFYPKVLLHLILFYC